MGSTDDDTRGGTLRVLEFYSGLGGMASPILISFLSIRFPWPCFLSLFVRFRFIFLVNLFNPLHIFGLWALSRTKRILVGTAWSHSFSVTIIDCSYGIRDLAFMPSFVAADRILV